MSSSTLASIQSHLTVYGYLVSIVLGNIGSFCIILFFSRQRHNACSIYLMSSAVTNDIYLTFNGFLQIFPFYYRDESVRAFILCKVRLYLANVLGLIASTMLILACIDRFLITSDRVSYRALSTPKRAKWLIYISVTFWALFCSHIVIMTTIINGQCVRFGVYSTIYTVYTVVFVAVSPPMVLGIFGYLTYHRLRQRLLRIQSDANHIAETNNHMRRQDRDLLVLVLSEVLFYVVTTIPYPIMLSESLVSQYIISNKSLQYLQIESFMFTIVFIILLLNNALPFYIYLIVSKPFRRNFQQLLVNSFRKVTRRPHNQIAPQTRKQTETARNL